MSINDLLLWMSMREQGSWTQFRDAVERFHIDLPPFWETVPRQLALSWHWIRYHSFWICDKSFVKLVIKSR